MEPTTNAATYVSIAIRTRHLEDGSRAFVWIEELVEVAEQSASALPYYY